jgi:hypothetical protein
MNVFDGVKGRSFEVTDSKVKFVETEEVTVTRKPEEFGDFCVAGEIHSAGIGGLINGMCISDRRAETYLHKRYGRAYLTFRIFTEIKPLVGEDYPDVLRQVMNQRRAWQAKKRADTGYYSSIGMRPLVPQ